MTPLEALRVEPDEEQMFEAEADDEEADETADELYFPAGQAVHAVAPAPELNPAKQGEQL